MSPVAMNCPPNPNPPPPAQQCLGTEFVIDGCGDMRVRGAGALAWPFSQPMPANNGLNFDQAQGIWTAPHGLYRATYGPGLSTVPAGSYGQNNSGGSPINTFPGGGSTWTPAAGSGAGSLPAVTFTNPSPCAKLALYWWMTSAVRLATWPGTFIDHRAVVDQQPVTARSAGCFLNPQNSPYSNSGWDDVRSIRPGTTPHGSLVAPGATVTLYPKLEVYVISPGSPNQCQLWAWAVWLTVLGYLIDPTQVGDAT